MRNYFQKNLGIHSLNIMWILFNSVLATATSVLLTFSTDAVFELNIKKLLFWSVIDVIAWGTMLISSYFQDVFQERLIQKICTQIRENMSNKMANENYREFHETKISQHISNYTNDVTTIEKNYLANFYSIIGNVFVIVASIIVLAYFHFLLLGITVAMAIVLLTVPNLFMKKLQSLTNSVSEANSKLVESVTNILKGFNVLYSYNRKSVLPRLIKKESQEYADSKVNYTKISTKVNNAIGGVSILCQIIISIVTGVLAILKMIPMGAISSMGNIAANLFNSLGQVGNEYSQLKSTRILFTKLAIDEEHHNIQDDNLEQTSMSFKEMITIENLNYTVEGKTIFKDFNLTIAKGDKVLIKGVSGVGKSTLLKIIGGQLTDYDGKVLVDGQDIKTIPYLELNEMITYVDQKPYLFSGSIADNITLFKDNVSGDAINRTLTLSKVDFINQVNDVVLDNGENLSVGQQQRIAIARYYLKNPPIVLLDEGTSALDHQNSVDVEYNLLKDKGQTLLEVAHHFNEENSHLFTKVVTL